MTEGRNRIEHLIILMMENRSFDHYLGSLSLPHEGRTDIEGFSSVLPTNSDENGVPISAWKMDGTYCGYDDPPHTWEDQHANYNRGANDGFVRQYQNRPKREHRTASSLPMGYYTRDTLPVLYALADQFTVCDHWFSSTLSSTWPNRKYFYSGCRDHDRETQVLPPFPGFKTTPFLDILEDTLDPRTGNRFTWKCYYSDLPFLGFWYQFTAFHAFNFANVSSFAQDCREDHLPTISIIDPPFTLASDHPSHDVRLGQKFIGLIVDALTHSDSWKKSALVILYDENGGFYDHVRPPSHFDSGLPVTPEEDAPLGFRVPALIISPYVRKQYACKTVFDHTSVLKSIALRWMPELHAEQFGSRWQNAPDIWGTCFDFEQSPLPIQTYTHTAPQADGKPAPTYNHLNWEEGIYDRLVHPIGDLEAYLERIFVLPGLKVLDQRARVYDTLRSMEQTVTTLKRMRER